MMACLVTSIEARLARTLVPDAPSPVRCPLFTREAASAVHSR